MSYSKQQLLDTFHVFDKAKTGLIPSNKFRKIFSLADPSYKAPPWTGDVDYKAWYSLEPEKNDAIEEIIKESKLEINGHIDYNAFIDIMLTK
jgi:Ca2+-binding EF-hand superfamily protein